MDYLAPSDMVALWTFVRRWYGAPSLPPSPLTTSRLAPHCLAEWHRVIAHWGGMPMRHNRPVPLQRLEIENGLVPFLVENQGTCLWAFDPSSSNFRVYRGMPSSGALQWVPAHQGLAIFLIHATVLEAALDAPTMKVAHGVPDGELLIVKSRAATPFPEWLWASGTSQLLVARNWLGVVEEPAKAEDRKDVTLAAKRMEDIEWAHVETSISWRSLGVAETPRASEPLPF